MTRSRSLFGLFAASLIACGGAAAGDSAPAKMAEPPPREEAPIAEPRSVEEAQKQIAQAVDDSNGRALKFTDSDSKPSSPREPSSTPTPKTEESATDAYTSKCANPCRALASMKRAVDALCRMTGETDTKCVDARKTLADNLGKTASCKCGS